MSRGDSIGLITDLDDREAGHGTALHEHDDDDGWWPAPDGQCYPPETHPDRRTSSPTGHPPPTPLAVAAAAKPYHSPARLARILQIGLVLLTILGAVAVGSSIAGYRLVNRIIGDPLSVAVADVEVSDDRQAVLWWSQLGGVVVVGIVFIAWTYVLYRNLRALGVEPRFGTGWAIGGWFIPFLNFWRPKQVIDDIWRGTAPERAASDTKITVSPLVHIWWAAWLTGWVLYRTAASRNSSTFESIRIDSLLTVAADAMFLLGAILAFWVVTRLTRRQQRAASSHSGVTVAEPGSSPVMAEHPTPVVSPRGAPRWLAAAALPITAIVVAGFAALAWDAGRSEGVSESADAIESGVGTLLEDLKTGDCYNLPADYDVSSADLQVLMAMEVVPCDVPHHGEVVAQTDLPASNDSFPGDEELWLTGLDRCRQPIEQYVGASWSESGLDLYVFSPTADSWQAGDREFICAAASLSRQPLNGSVKDTGGILASNETMVFNLAEGDCYDDSASTGDTVLELVDCAAPHDNEVFAVVDFPAGPVSAYPGQDELEEFMNQASEEEFERRIDPALRDDLSHFQIGPGLGTWVLGDRSIVLILYNRNLDKLEGSMVRSN